MGSAEGYGKARKGLFFPLSLSLSASPRLRRGSSYPKPRLLSEALRLPPSLFFFFFCHIMRHGRGGRQFRFERSSAHLGEVTWSEVRIKKKKKIRKVDVLGRRK